MASGIVLIVMLWHDMEWNAMLVMARLLYMIIVRLWYGCDMVIAWIRTAMVTVWCGYGYGVVMAWFWNGHCGVGLWYDMVFLWYGHVFIVDAALLPICKGGSIVCLSGRGTQAVTDADRVRSIQEALSILEERCV